MSQIGDCSTATPRRSVLPSSSSGLVWGDEDLPVTPPPSTHTFLHISICALMHAVPEADILLPVHSNAHTQTQAKKTQTDRQTEHTQAADMRKKPSKSTNMKQSAEADRYEEASAADAHSHVRSCVQDARSRARCTNTDAQEFTAEETGEGRESHPCSAGARHTHKHTHLWFFGQHT